ncbi:hypothetical protein PFISCL1PPCAC_13985, partial [Pristionchus fissidentatus]
EAIFGLASLYTLLVTLGVCTNALIITATITSKSLHGTCNILIAFCALSDIMHLLGHLPKIVPVFAGSIEISSFMCCILQVVPNFGLSAGTFLVLSIALDRLFSVRQAFFYVKTSVSQYLSKHIFAILAYAALQYFLIAIYFEDARVACNPAAAYHGRGKELWGAASMLVYLLAVAVYVVVWRELTSVGVTTDIREARSVSLTIFAVMAVVICGWFLSMCLVMTNSVVLRLQDRQLYLFMEVAGIPANTSISINYFVLYATSSEYRAAFKQQLCSIPCIGRIFSK